MLNNWQLGNIFFDTTRRMLVVGDQQLYLEPRIFDLLLALLSADQQQLSREQLIAQVWQGRVVSESAINRAVSLLRKALTQLDASQPYLETLPKVGYRLLVSVTMLQASMIQPDMAPLSREPVIAVAEQPSPATPVTAIKSAPVTARRNLLQRSGWWLPLLLLALLVLQVYWQQQQPASLPTLAVPTPRTSDEGVETQLSLSLDGQWFSYLQQDGQHRRWFLQPAGQAIPNQPRLEVEVPAGDLRFTSLSPDRHWLLYELCQQQDCKLWLKQSPIATETTLAAGSTPAKTSQPDQLLLQLPVDSQLQMSWQQDSQAIYYRQRPDKTKPYALFRLDLITRAIQQLTQPLGPGGDIALAISADASKLAVVSYLQQAKSLLRIYQRQDMKILAEQEVPFAVNAISWHNDDQLLFGCAEQICRWRISSATVQPLLHTGAVVESLRWQTGQLWYATVQAKMAIWRQGRPKMAKDAPAGSGGNDWPAAQQVIASSRIDWMPRVVGDDLVFLTNRQGEQQIWRKTALHSEQWLASLPPPAEFARLALSHDGQELVFSHLGAIYVLTIASGQVQQVLDASAKAAVVNFAQDETGMAKSAGSGMLIYSSTKSGDYQLWLLDRSTGQSTQLTRHGGYSGYFRQGELWYSKYHQDGLYRLNPSGEEQRILKDFDKINWLNWQLLQDELYFYQPDQGLMLFSVATPELPPRLLLPTPERFMHHYQWTQDALWYVRRDQSQGDVYQVALP